ncbi:DHHA1 domain-containing protein [Thermofilum pendens]|uniref:Phosphoesterase, DHHA1 n=1 Tax=Thermofilum pendens (strain DSM 2475 / Hrk 5) TaxID=368408 RepID=A1S0D5_THEPD|nr:DHHA1 domain-containing protein [Thermofilum pendens]ABL78915.1 phosphoesterase, DHHA1 [Thermofilum pendens Hrk 5]
MAGVILAHGDSDGVTAAAIAKSVYRDAEVFFTHPVGLAKDLEEFARGRSPVIILDVAVDEAGAPRLAEVLRSLGAEVVYVDHHPGGEALEKIRVPGVRVVHEEGPCAAELAYRFFKPPREMSRVALYGAIGDHALGTAWVAEALEEWDLKTLFFDAGVLVLALEALGRDYESKRRVVDLLAGGGVPSREKSLVELAARQSLLNEELRVRVREKALVVGQVAYVMDPGGSLGTAAFYARVERGVKVGVAVERRGETCVMSLRSTGGVDLNALLRRIAPRHGGHGGGHRQAAGARIPCGELEKFLAELAASLDR